MRAGEQGFTLVEVLVSMTLLTIIGAVMAVIFSVGMRAILAPGASEDRLTASSQSITLEQLITEDVHRATCIEYVSGTQSLSAYGYCVGANQGSTSDFFNGRCAATAGAICIGWPNSGGCEMALYTLAPARASRSSGMIETGTLTATDYPAVTVRSSPPLDTWRSTGLKVPITVIAGNLLSTSLTIQPLATDPWGSGSASTC